MRVKDICDIIEDIAPLSLQEKYDNSGLIIGNFDTDVSGILITIDVTHDVVLEAIEKNCNLIVSHHPLIFNPLKKITGKTETEKCIIGAIKNDIAIYAAHTNLDNTINGVSGKMAEKIGLINKSVLLPIDKCLLKLVTFIPQLYSYKLREALFNAGAGHIGNYDFCSFNSEGYGTFRANDQANPFVGENNQLHTENETRIEVIFPEHKKNEVIAALYKTHPYEEPAFDIIQLDNQRNDIGAGVIGELPDAVDEVTFIKRLKSLFNSKVIRHTNLSGKKIKKIALCGGAGSFLLREAINQQADIFISGDFKYHEFHAAENKIIIADIGHFESEQYTKDVFYEIIRKKISTFAIQISEINTNPINYL
jgi:dinuclear metal center YbgI/SA1388 family protein